MPRCQIIAAAVNEAQTVDIGSRGRAGERASEEEEDVETTQSVGLDADRGLGLGRFRCGITVVRSAAVIRLDDDRCN